jgi:hypothetical protein
VDCLIDVDGQNFGSAECKKITSQVTLSSAT